MEPSSLVGSKWYRVDRVSAIHGPEYQEFPVFKGTTCGVWLSFTSDTGFGIRVSCVWVDKNAKKRFAYPTKRQALASFIARKSRYEKILLHKHGICVEQLALAKKYALVKISKEVEHE